MKKDFVEYIKTEFGFSDEEVAKFEEALKRPLKKSVRINTRKISIEDFKKKVEAKGWILTSTPLGKNIFYVDRPEEQLNIALGNTPEHISGYFYVQEVAASSSPFYMSADKIDDGKYIILDMSASPGGKTTQLLEYYPNSLIVANELDKSRLKGFFSNLDRMSALKAVATNYDGRFFKQIPELFDKVLLDAPCSGEGTAFKTDDALKYRNLKNIKNVAKLQFGLLEAAIKTTKPGGEIVYSTCTLNKFENEGVINKALEKYGEYVEIVPIRPHPNPLLGEEREQEQFNTPSTNKGERARGGGFFKRNWPHLDLTGGFFIAKLKKVKSISTDESLPLTRGKARMGAVKQNFEKLSRNEESLVSDFFNKFGYDLKGKYLYKYKDEIHLTSENLNYIWDKIFLYKIGVNIGNIKDNSFVPTYYAGTFEKFSKNTVVLDKDGLDKLLQGFELEQNLEDGYYQVIHEDIPVGIAKQKNGMLKSMVPTKMMRK
ncbi:MAG: NOL1/NOP2/sun family putative RNA methylase [Candidatus Gracilibacteria bacterium]|nr:NOL1/NOP2/sun family putative RNA methylase [Candidatus Gracilibacteria bacterium]